MFVIAQTERLRSGVVRSFFLASSQQTRFLERFQCAWTESVIKFDENSIFAHQRRDSTFPHTYGEGKVRWSQLVPLNWFSIRSKRLTRTIWNVHMTLMEITFRTDFGVIWMNRVGWPTEFPRDTPNFR